LIFVTACSFSCGKGHNNKSRTETVSNLGSADTLPHPVKQQTAAHKTESISHTEWLKLIRENCRRINLITHWSAVKTEELFETTEGGEATYYNQNGRLEKITTQNFGETYQQIREYYLMDGQLCFVFEKSFQYNRPMYYDTTAMKENNDTEAFDMDKSKITETRSYFLKGKLFHRNVNGISTSHNVKDSLEEEKEIMLGDFQRLIKKS
jgi:hypothetical protein